MRHQNVGAPCGGVIPGPVLRCRGMSPRPNYGGPVRRTLVPLLAALFSAALAAPAAGAAPPPGGLTMLDCVAASSEAAPRGCASCSAALRCLHVALLRLHHNHLSVAVGRLMS